MSRRWRWVALAVAGLGAVSGSIAVAQSNLRLTFERKDVATSGPDPLLLATQLATEIGASGDDCAAVATDVERGADAWVVLITADRCRDDSVRATRFRVDLARRPDGIWEATWAGLKWRCYRGVVDLGWTTGKCS